MYYDYNNRRDIIIKINTKDNEYPVYERKVYDLFTCATTFTPNKKINIYK